MNLDISRVCPRCLQRSLEACRIHTNNNDTIIICKTKGCLFPLDEPNIEKYIKSEQDDMENDLIEFLSS
jgi:transcription elongation factor Elf1